MAWHRPLKRTLEFVADLIISKPAFFASLSTFNLTVTDVLGRGQRAVVYKVEDHSFPDTFYAAKYFDDFTECHHEERILRLFQGDRFSTAPISRLVADQMVNCQHHRGFLMQYVRGLSVHSLRSEVARRHHPSGDPLHFIRDLGDEMVSALTDYVHSAGVYHGDISSGNIMYDVETKRFHLIDFGISHNVDRNRNPFFGGSWQNFGPSA